MNRIKNFLAPASLAINVFSPKVYLQAIPHHNLNIYSKALFPETNYFSEYCKKSSVSMDNLDRKILPQKVDDLETQNDEIKCALQKMHLSTSVDEDVNKFDVNSNNDSGKIIKSKSFFEESQYSRLRKWKKTNTEMNPDKSFIFKLISFNILAQDLLEWHPYLYKNHDKKFLHWEKRKLLVIKEILDTNAEIICLQEMQDTHLEDFLKPFQDKKFKHLYKKRTNNKTDGLLLLFREDIFNLLESCEVELYRAGIELLNRDNVGLIAKFALKENPETKFIIATTHLLFNPRRNDVRLGQVQLLFAEIERMSFVENTLIGPEYLPIVLSGDFNLTPYSGVYRFVTEGSIEFEGKGRNLEKDDYRFLSNSLIPPHLYITDECQHFHVLSKRLSGNNREVMLSVTENPNLMNSDNTTSNSVDSNTTRYQKIEIADGHYVTFSSGLLTHPFQLKSVYSHRDEKGQYEATTFQDQWVTVDYIFYRNLKPIEKYVLPTVEECKKIFPTIPNSKVGSDHFCLGATFQLNKK